MTKTFEHTHRYVATSACLTDTGGPDIRLALSTCWIEAISFDTPIPLQCNLVWGNINLELHVKMGFIHLMEESQLPLRLQRITGGIVNSMIYIYIYHCEEET